MNSSGKCNFLYGIQAGTAKFLINMFNGPFLDHTQDSHDYWRNGSFMVPHFLKSPYVISLHKDKSIIHIIVIIKQFDGEALVMLELWGMRRTSSLPSLPGPL